MYALALIGNALGLWRHEAHNQIPPPLLDFQARKRGRLCNHLPEPFLVHTPPAHLEVRLLTERHTPSVARVKGFLVRTHTGIINASTMRLLVIAASSEMAAAWTPASPSSWTISPTCCTLLAFSSIALAALLRLLMTHLHTRWPMRKQFAAPANTLDRVSQRSLIMCNTPFKPCAYTGFTQAAPLCHEVLSSTVDVRSYLWTQLLHAPHERPALVHIPCRYGELGRETDLTLPGLPFPMPVYRLWKDTCASNATIHWQPIKPCLRRTMSDMTSIRMRVMSLHVAEIPSTQRSVIEVITLGGCLLLRTMLQSMVCCHVTTALCLALGHSAIVIHTSQGIPMPENGLLTTMDGPYILMACSNMFVCTRCHEPLQGETLPLNEHNEHPACWSTTSFTIPCSWVLVCDPVPIGRSGPDRLIYPTEASSPD